MDALLVLLKNVVLSTLHGWVGASLAVFMFFRPLKPWRIGRVRIWQGVIPAQQARIADAVSGVVARELLTPQALCDYLVREQALDHRVRSTLHELVELVAGKDYPSVEAIFPPPAAGLREELKNRAKEALARWALGYTTDPGVETWLRGFMHRRLKPLWQKRAGELWPEARAEATVRRLLDEATAYLNGPEFADAALSLIVQAHGTLCRQEMPLRDVLPRPLQEEVAQWPAGLARILPELVKRLGDNEEVQERLTALILDVMEQLKDKGWWARLGIGLFQYFSEYRVEVEGFVRRDLFPRLSEFLAAPEMQLRLEQYIRAQTDAVLDRPVGALAGALNPRQLEQVSAWLAGHMRAWLTGPQAQAWLRGICLERYRVLAGSTTAELCRRYAGVAPEKVEEALARHGLALLRRPVTARFVRLAARALVEEVAAYPVGRLRDRFSPGTLEKVETVAAGLITTYLKSKIPSFLGQLDLAGIVRTKIESYSTRELVDMFQRVTMNSLQKIEIYGAVIGAVMGIFFGLANLRADAFWFIAAVLVFVIGILRFLSVKD